MALFFISYKRNETSKAFATELRQRLQAEAGFTVWMDTDIEPGSEWKIAIDNAINDSIAVLVVITPESLKSQYVTYEWSFALGKGKLVIPLLLEAPDPNNQDHPKIHPKLADIQYGTDFTGYSEAIDNEDWSELIKILTNVKDEIYVPDDIQDAKRMLKGADFNQQIAAIQHLKDAQTKHAQDALAEFVSYPNQNISMGVSIALAVNYNDERAIPGLLSALDRQKTSPKDKEDIVGFLGDLGSADSLGALIKILNDLEKKEKIRNLAVNAIAKIGGDQAVEGLIKFIETADPKVDPNVTTDAVTALEKLGDIRAVPVLKNIMKSRNIGSIEKGITEVRLELSRFEISVLKALAKLGDTEAQKLYERYKSSRN